MHYFIFTFSLILMTMAASFAEAKYASIVINANTGEIYHEENADTMNYPASLTKMMTLYLLFERMESGEINSNTLLRVSRKAANASPSKLGVSAGGNITVNDAILALAVKSANDVAVVVAEALSGTEREFAKAMTQKAHELGMENTYFRNASGLPNRGQLSSARDMSVLATALLTDFPQYYGFFSTTNFSYNGHNYRNHNKLLRAYEGTDGLKTGYTRSSGFNIAVSSKRGPTRIIAVVFGGKTSKWRDRHAINLMNQAWKMVGSVPMPRAKPTLVPIPKAKPVLVPTPKKKPRIGPMPIPKPIV